MLNNYLSSAKLIPDDHKYAQMERPSFNLEQTQESQLSIKSPQIVPQSVKDLSFALFMGSTLDAKYKNIFIAGRNRQIVEFFSRPISQVNKQYFKL